MCEAYTIKEGKATKFLNSWTDPLSNNLLRLIVFVLTGFLRKTP